MEKQNPRVQLTIDGLNEKGYGLANDSGNKYQILNALPGETLKAEIFKRRKAIRYGVAENIISPSSERTIPKSTCFLETSPWEIMKYAYENSVKSDYLTRLIHEIYPKTVEVPVAYGDNDYHYRNKMEFSFYFDQDNRISFGFHKRDSKRGKVKTERSELLPTVVNTLLTEFLLFINNQNHPSNSLKGLVVRYSFYEQKVILILFVKDPEFAHLAYSDFVDKSGIMKSIIVVYSDMRSPAFVESSTLFSKGETTLTEKIGNLHLSYPYNSFFQVNPDVFGICLKDINQYITSLQDFIKLKVGEYYAGVGTIGLGISTNVASVEAVELYSGSSLYAEVNAKQNSITNYTLIEEKAENIADTISKYDLVIFDPPRVGLHQKILDALIKYVPKHIVYLSCNPKSQIENLRELSDRYTLKRYKGYNFYPKTPHMEALAILERHD